MLDAEHNFAPPVPGGIDVAMVASVKPRSKPAGDTTCKTDTRVWPRRKSNKLQWADVFCKLHTSYVSSIHTSCMAPRRGYDPHGLSLIGCDCVCLTSSRNHQSLTPSELQRNFPRVSPQKACSSILPHQPVVCSERHGKGTSSL